MKTLIIGDTHIAESYIDEQQKIFDEILKYEADCCIHLGDMWDSNRPTPRELEFGTDIIKRFKSNYKDVIILSGTGRHDWLNNCSAVAFLKNLGVSVVGTSYDKVIDGLKCKFAHAMTDQSTHSFGNYKYKVADLEKNYDYIFLGHNHSPQDISANTFHIGSIFWQNFKESNDKFKRIAILDNRELIFHKLFTPIQMYDLTSLSDLEKMTPHAKVRMIISSFSQHKQFVKICDQYKKKFKL